ncbi:hypothetical protein LSH36_522g00009 [Paralvinella palmiformis]|uniref:Uncharacterized protein n=1 Tax=Paralvinella palmiformis TaxID=53620 RepID=A0AAD9MWG3_9ANNE|nr:hypothetical protein LSH36_522g00009 [Paralvinella palmiformis]
MLKMEFRIIFISYSARKKRE